MSQVYPKVDPDGLLEYSVVFTDRSLNHMSPAFQGVMRGLSQLLKQTYNAAAVAVVPGGGTYGMEAVARQFAADKKCLVIRNGWFSYRWTQIFEACRLPREHLVLKAQPREAGANAPFAPPPLDVVVQAIAAERPEVVFAPHVETSSGMLLPHDYLRGVAEAVQRVGGLFVLDCVASGALWIDMATCGVDVLITAPQKGWSGSPCAAFVMLGAEARRRCEQTQSSSFACDLRKWLQVMDAYEAGGHTYHATLPTDALSQSYRQMQEMAAFGLTKLAERQRELGTQVRALLAAHGFASVAATGFTAPGVVVSYTDDDGIHKGTSFAKLGLQTAAGVPLMCDEPAGFKTFRLGLFGLDKLQHVDRTVATLQQALTQLGK